MFDLLVVKSKVRNEHNQFVVHEVQKSHKRAKAVNGSVK